MAGAFEAGREVVVDNSSVQPRVWLVVEEWQKASPERPVGSSSKRALVTRLGR